MKKTIKNLFIAILVIVPMVSTVQKVSATFPDVPADHIYADAINYVQEEGIVSGYSDGEFKAENTITRAEFTKIIINAKYNEEEINGCQTKYGYAYSSDINTKNIFPDVEALGKFSSYICMAKENGVVNGYGDGNYYPDRPITVGEASKIISNAYGLTDIQNPTNPDKFKPFVDALSARKAIPEGIISIGDYLKRGEMAEIIYRLENNITFKSSLTYSQIDVSQYDIKNGYTFYYPNAWIALASADSYLINTGLISVYEGEYGQNGGCSVWLKNKIQSSYYIGVDDRKAKMDDGAVCWSANLNYELVEQRQIKVNNIDYTLDIGKWYKDSNLGMTSFDETKWEGDYIVSFSMGIQTDFAMVYKGNLKEQQLDEFVRMAVNIVE